MNEGEAPPAGRCYIVTRPSAAPPPPPPSLPPSPRGGSTAAAAAAAAGSAGPALKKRGEPSVLRASPPLAVACGPAPRPQTPRTERASGGEEKERRQRAGQAGRAGSAASTAPPSRRQPAPPSPPPPHLAPPAAGGERERVFDYFFRYILFILPGPRRARPVPGDRPPPRLFPEDSQRSRSSRGYRWGVRRSGPRFLLCPLPASPPGTDRRFPPPCSRSSADGPAARR